MAIARKHQVDESLPSCFHGISRCVRRAYLCGGAAEHRREWVRDRIRAAAASFAVDVLAYAVMSNHLHIVVSTEPSRVTTRTALGDRSPAHGRRRRAGAVERCRDHRQGQQRRVGGQGSAAPALAVVVYEIH